MDLFVRSYCWMLLWLKILYSYRFVKFLSMLLEDLEIKDGQNTHLLFCCILFTVHLLSCCTYFYRQLYWKITFARTSDTLTWIELYDSECFK